MQGSVRHRRCSVYNEIHTVLTIRRVDLTLYKYDNCCSISKLRIAQTSKFQNQSSRWRRQAAAAAAAAEANPTGHAHAVEPGLARSRCPPGWPAADIDMRSQSVTRPAGLQGLSSNSPWRLTSLAETFNTA